MTTVEEIKLTRSLHLEKIKTAYKKLGDHIKNQRSRMVDKYFEEVKSSYSDFESAHIQFALKSKLDLSDDSMKEVSTCANEYLELAEKMVDNFTEQQMIKESVNNKELKKVEERKTRSKFTAELEEFLKLLQEYIDKVDVDEALNTDALSAEIAYMEDRYKEIMKVYDVILSGTEDLEIAEVVGKKSQAERKYREGLFTLRSYVSNKTPQNSPPSSRSSSRKSSPERESFRHKKIDFPKFGGSLRQFVTFKRDFQDMVVEPGYYEKKQMSHILRNECLTGEARNAVHNLHDYDALWAKLDSLYDDEAEVVDQISKQITNLKRLEEEDYDGFVKLVDVIEKADLDLSAMGSTTVLNNPITVRLIMGKCPRSVKEGITRELSNKKQDEEFDAMLKYLIPRRRDALRLSRLNKDEDKNRGFQGRQKGAFHAVDGQEDEDSDAGDRYEKKQWNCIVYDCKYKQKHFLSECRAFKKLDPTGKGKVVLKKSLCVLCFGNHSLSDCPKKAAGWRECDVNGCGKWHSRLLHGATVPGLVLHTQGESRVEISNLNTGNSKTLLLIQEIPTTTNANCLVFWDHGSTTSLVTFKYAAAAGLEGTDCCFELTGVGEKVNMYSTKLYIIPLKDKDGNITEIHAYGIERITADMKPVNLETAAETFKINPDHLIRPVGAVDLLIGISHVDIMPTKSEVSGKLALYKSCFGTGFMLGGVLEGVNMGEEIDDFAHSVSHAEVRNIRPIDFLSVEGFGIDIPRRCKHCKGCKECGFKANQLTWTESKELSHIEKGLTLDTVKKVWTAEYPFHTDPTVLQDNFYQAQACLLSLEKRLVRNKELDQFNAQFKDAVDRGVFQEINKKEASLYQGPVNYITITEAYKEGDQVTTPLRLCMNSSMKYKGVSLNDLLMKGPSALNNIYSVLLNFRTYPVGFVKDISKFYQSVLASLRDQHLRRVLWREGDGNKEPKIFVTRTVNFGDKPAGCVALTALRETAKLYKNIHPEAARKLMDDNYCDDLATGAETRDEAIETSRNMDIIVQHGGFTFKSTVMSGDKGEPRRVLGTGWDTECDTLFIEAKVNVSPKRKGVHTLPNIQFDVIKDNFPVSLTKRIIWRVVLGQFDLLGLASVFLIRLKLLMRDLSGEDGRKFGWDDAVPSSVRERFILLLEMLKDVQELRFPRCIKPDGYNKERKPDLICFGDGSKQAFCSLAYIRWEMEDGSYKCFLVSGKTRVAPLKKISVPRIELMGSVAAVRLAESIQSSMKLEFGRRFFLTDSSAAFGMIRGECGAFQEFVGTRTGEIKSKSNPETEWFWVPTKENLADLGTRDDVTPTSLGADSVYLNGLPWMQKKEDEWPVNRNPGKVPEEEMISGARTVLYIDAGKSLLEITRFSSFSKISRILVLVLKFIDKLRKKNDKLTVLSEKEYREKSENYWFLAAQEETKKKFKTGNLSSLRPRITLVQIGNNQQELIVTSGRLGGALAVGYDKEYLPILDASSVISKLIMKDAHEEEHCGEDRTLWRSRNIAWVVGGKRIARKIKRNCFKCKLREKVMERQIMAPVSESRIPPAPVFYSTAVDLFGPIQIKDTVKRRTNRKCWGVLFCCTATSAVHLEVTEDYTCDSFLLCLRRFFNLRGVPARIQSDPGSQLMAAATELGKWDFSRIQEWSAGMKTEWHFIPADSQHFNGCAEAMIKVTKNQLSQSLKSDNFTKGELDTFLSDAAFIVNSRPLMKVAAEDPLSGGPITPLHLMGGRCTKNIPTINLDCKPSLTKRLRFIEETTKEFWNKWFLQVFHNLVPSYKWKHKYRDVQVGDIVLLKDSNQLRYEYRLARVKETYPGIDGHVRRVTLEYKNLNESGDISRSVTDLKKARFITVERSIQNIAVIVPADWRQKDIELEVTSGLKLKSAF